MPVPHSGQQVASNAYRSQKFARNDERNGFIFRIIVPLLISRLSSAFRLRVDFHFFIHEIDNPVDRNSTASIDAILNSPIVSQRGITDLHDQADILGLGMSL